MTGRAKRIKYSVVVFALVSLFAFADNASAQYGPYCDHYYVPLQTALDAMNSDAQVSVTTRTVAGWSTPNYYYEFSPAFGSATEALIIYPGACLDERAYAVEAHDIAAAGYLVAIVPMPDYVAFLGNQGRADAVISNHPEIATWSIGGHSLGGVGACSYVNSSYTYNNKINGIVLWASYPASSISTKPVKVISIWGTNDGYTTSDKIDASKPLLPPDTRYVALQGANHSQFGAYGFSATDYSFVQPNPAPGDNAATITRQQQTDLIVSYTLNFLDSLTLTPTVPAALETITAKDDSTWERVSAPGFGDPNNTDVVSLTPFQGNLYALTRNDETGFELWKTTVGNGWHRITVQGFTDQNDFSGYLKNPLPENPFVYGPALKYNLNMNIWGDMIEFKGKLYVAVSTGYQGSALFGSQGTMIWRTDGVQWEPVIGRGVVHDVSGAITAISSCAANDGSYTASLTDSTKNWAVNSLAGSTLTVEAAYTSTTHGTSGLVVPGLRLFRIISNTNNTLTVQEVEKANNTTQYTICAEHAGGGDAGRARNFVAGFTVGAAYRIDVGSNSQGFGDMWNKSIIDLEVLNDELFASIGLNYEQGARVMRTSDGITWVADSAYSMGNIHGYDWHDGSSLTTCPDSTSSVRNTPVSSSATKMIKSSVNGGVEKLFVGGTGTGGCNGRGARVYRRDAPEGWTPIVDILVDSNSTGTNENGFGWPAFQNDFFYSAFQAWSWAEYNGRLFVGIARLEGGGMIMYTQDGSDIDGAWQSSMGENPTTYNTNTDGTRITVPPLYDPAYTGFGDVLNTASYLHTFNGALYAGTLVTNLSLYYSNPIDGADIWKGIWDDQNNKMNWTLVNSNGFGDATVLQFQSFTDYGNTMYVAAATVNPSDFHGQEPANYTGVKIYRLQVPAPTTTTVPATTTTTASVTTTTTAPVTTTTTALPTLINLSSFNAQGIWRFVIMTWKTESEVNNAGFNIYRAETEDGDYVKINASLIPAKGSTTEGANYRYIDQTAKRGTTYYYKLEDVNMSGNATMHGPVSVSTWSLFSLFKK